MQQGQHLGKNFIAMKKGKEPTPFNYFDKGSMAIIGTSKAVADLTTPHKSFTGWFAWVMRLFIHLFQLINYRNCIKIMWDWTIAYFTEDQSLGMIVCPSEKLDTGKASSETKGRYSITQLLPMSE